MNKNTIIYAAIVVSIAMVGFIVFSGQQDFETQYTSLKASGELSKTVNPTKDVEVKYQTTTKTVEQKNKEQVKKREKYIEEKTTDASKKFEISLINTEAWDENKQTTSFVRIAGKIDNSPFLLRVPSYLIENRNDVKMKIKNIQTGQEQTIPAAFTSSLKLGASGLSNNLNINSNDLSNYSFSQEQGILPLPGGDTPPSPPSN